MTSLVASTSICGVVFLVTVWAHELAHGIAWVLQDADGVRVRFGRVVVDGSLPRTAASGAAIVLASGPAVTLVQALGSIGACRSAGLQGPVVSRVATWSAVISSAYLSYALLTNRTGNDAGRLLAMADAPGAAARAVSFLGLVLLVAVGVVAARRLAASHATASTAGTAAVAFRGVLAWAMAVALPFAIVVAGPDRWHAAGMGGFLLGTIAFGPGRPVRHERLGHVRTAVLAACFLGTWLASWSLESAGGLRLG